MAKLPHLAFRTRHKGLLASSPLIPKMNPVANELKLPVISLKSVAVSHGMAVTHLCVDALFCPTLTTRISFRPIFQDAAQRLLHKDSSGRRWSLLPPEVNPGVSSHPLQAERYLKRAAPCPPLGLNCCQGWPMSSGSHCTGGQSLFPS